MKQGTDDKKTVLNDDAAIYAKRDQRSDKEKWADMNGAEKWRFFRDYYLFRIIAVIGIAAFVGWMLWSIVSPKKEERLNIVISESPFEVEQKQAMSEAMAERIGLDEKHESIIIDDTYFLAGNDYAANMKFVAIVAAQEMDVMMAMKSVCQTQVNNEVLMDLSNILPKRILDRLEEYAIRIKPMVIDQDTGETVVKDEGIYLLNIKPYLEKCGHENPARDPYVVGVPVNCKNIYETISFICYLFDIDFEMPTEE